MVSDVAWLGHHPGHVSVAHDDIYAFQHTRSSAVDLTGFHGETSTLTQNSMVWKQVTNIQYLETELLFKRF